MSKQTQQTWGGRFSEAPSDLMVRFSESVSFDCRLAPFDVQGSKAHAKMLCHVGILTEAERDAIVAGLDAVLADISAGNVLWDPTLEDVHMNIERRLTERVPEASKLHTARSRNDQIATDMRLFFKAACGDVMETIREAQRALVACAKTHADIRIPGYTHLQRAQPVTVAHHLLAYVEMLERDARRFAHVHNEANVCPLGSGAIAGSTLPIDRAFTARELGFVDEAGEPRLTQNSMDAVADRDVFIDFANACATCLTHLSRAAEDIILWNSAEFGFVDLPDTFTTGSSLMPQKKNPDSLELIRGKCGRVHGHVTALYSMVKGLPLTYNRDLQEDKPPVFDALDQTLDCLRVFAGTVAGMTFRADRCAAAVADPLLLATDVADFLVDRGVPFRQAHHIVGALVAAAEAASIPLDKLPDAEAKAIHAELADGAWRACFDLDRALAARERPGMPGPQVTAERIAAWKSRLGAE